MVQLSLCRNFCRISFIVFFQSFSLALHRTCPAHAPTRACVLLLTGDKLQWGSRSINISKINIRKQHKSDPTQSLSWPKCFFTNLIPTKQSLNYLIHLLTDEPLDGDLENTHFHFYSQTLDFIIKERSPCFSRFSMYFSSPVRTLPLVSIPFPKM